jgi:hypothetical protein
MVRANKADSAAYMREWRAANPALQQKNAAAVAARKRALVRLGAMYPTTLWALLDEERALRGLPPLGTEPNAPRASRPPAET